MWDKSEDNEDEGLASWRNCSEERKNGEERVNEDSEILYLSKQKNDFVMNRLGKAKNHPWAQLIYKINFFLRTRARRSTMLSKFAFRFIVDS